MVHIKIPYSQEKNLGKAYNDAMRLALPSQWICLMDYDVMLLTPDAGNILHKYAQIADKQSVLTCYTNRLSPAAKMQLLDGKVSDDSNIRNHILLAENQKKDLYKLDEIPVDISGFLMMINKELWDEMKFDDDLKCLGVDTDYSIKMRHTKRKIYRMSGLYAFHQYRITKDIKDKTHLL